MPVGGKDQDDDLRVVDFINKAVLFSDAAAPSAGVSLQLLRMPCACFGMNPQFINKALRLLKRPGFMFEQLEQITLRLLVDFHSINHNRDALGNR